MDKLKIEQLGNFSESKRVNPNQNRVYDPNGICPCMNSMQGGGLQPMIVDTICLNSKGGRNGQEGLQPSVQDRVYDPDGISFAMTTSFQPKIVEYLPCAMRGRGDGWKQQLEVRSDGCTNALTSVTKDNLVLSEQRVEYKENWTWDVNGQLYRIRIRKLTPREAWRLMSFSDSDFEKAEDVNSNTQLYKQAGNSIVKQCLMGIFGCLNLKGDALKNA